VRLARRWAKRAAAAGAVTLLFWAASVAASTIPRLEPLQTNVHGLSLADYRSNPVRPLAPLSHRIIEEATRDASTFKAPAPAPGSSPSPTPTPTPEPRPTPTPSPTPTPPLPSATPLPTPPPVLNGTIQGLVKSATTSAPIAGTLIQTAGGSTSTDGSGSYRLSLAPGFYAVTASAPGYLAQTKNAAALTGQTFQLDYALAPTPGSINGLVLDSSTNLGIPNATVSLNSGGLTTTTDLTGAFTFAAVNPGTYTVSASAMTYSPSTQTVTVLAGQSVNVTLKLKRSLL